MLGLLLGLTVIALLTITLAIVRDYFTKKKEIDRVKTGILIREYLDSGKYRVIGGVLDSNKKVLNAQSWEAKDMDDELKAEFGQKKKIVYDMTA